MLRVNIAIYDISAERFMDARQPLPQVQISTNFSLTGIEKKTDDSLEFPFVVTINYNPSVAQISLKGRAYLVGGKDEIGNIYRDNQEKKPPPAVVMQSISNVTFVECILISRTLNIPPPIPLPIISENKSTDKKLAQDYSA